MQILTPDIDLKILKPLVPDKVKFIVIHHPMAKKASWRDIDRWHKERGWAGAGYNEYIRKDGNVYILRGEYEGVHAKGHNSESYGICVEGNYDIEKILPNEQQYALKIRILTLLKRYRNSKVVYHRDICSTDCPGKFFPDIKKLFDESELSKYKDTLYISRLP